MTASKAILVIMDGWGLGKVKTPMLSKTHMFHL